MAPTEVVEEPFGDHFVYHEEVPGAKRLLVEAARLAAVLRSHRSPLLFWLALPEPADRLEEEDERQQQRPADPIQGSYVRSPPADRAFSRPQPPRDCCHGRSLSLSATPRFEQPFCRPFANPLAVRYARMTTPAAAQREVWSLRFLSGSRPGRWIVWMVCRALNKSLPVPHAAGWMMIPEHSVEQVLETGALRSLYPQDVLEAARRMDRQRREHDERYAGNS